MYPCLQWRKDLVELLGLPETNCNPAKQTKPNPTLQVLFSSWDELKPKIENEDAYMVLSNEERVEVLKDYLEVCEMISINLANNGPLFQKAKV